jgi:pimeloyl-ACP methyl ester carboxylesterase
MWEPVLNRLGQDRDVVAVDLPGFGASPMPPPGTPPGIGSLTRLLSEFFHDLGLDLHVAGNSLGGWLALELGRRGSAASATGLSPAGFHNRVASAFQRVSLWLAHRSARLFAPRADRLLTRPGVRKLAAGQFMVRPEQMTSTGGGEQIDVPVTIAWGEKDRLLRPHQATRAARAIPCARMLTLTGVGTSRHTTTRSMWRACSWRAVAAASR